MLYRYLTLLVILSSCLNGYAAEWQWSVPVKGAREGHGAARAFLWIPPDCKQVRAVVVAQHNMEELSILESPLFREAMSGLGFAAVWVSPPFDHLFRFNEGAGEVFDSMMRDLAGVSGYAELAAAPVVPIGHSAAASWPYYFAAWNPGRTLAAISVSGQWPYFRSPVFAPDIWGNRHVDGIPLLETMGEYEAAETWSAEGLKERSEHPHMALSMLANPAQGHFAATDEKIAYICLYIRKAAQYRLPVKGASALRPIDPVKTGWLADKWRSDRPPTAPAAPAGRYAGDPAQAFWYFDEEMAKATERYQAAYRNRKAQLLGYVQDERIMPQRNTHQQVDLQFRPLGDGLTFVLKGAFLDTVPGASPRTADWTKLPAGAPVGHAAGGGPVVIERICGPFRKVAADTFMVAMERGASGQEKQYQLWFAAMHPGDDIYKPAVQQAQMLIPARNTEGEPQQITFPRIPNQPRSKRSVTLHAVSSAKAPVHYYVREGPAEIDGDVLRFTKIPPRSRFPLKVTVVAWQRGRSVAPKLQTAEPVVQTFLVYR